MIFSVQRLMTCAVAVSYILTAHADGNGLETLFKKPPPNTTRLSVVLPLGQACSDGDWVSRQLERVRDAGAGGVLLCGATAGEDGWRVLAAAVSRAQQLGLDVGIQDFPLSAEEGATLPRAQRLVWSRTSVTNGEPQIARTAEAPREIVRLAVPDNNGTLLPHQVLDLAHTQVPTNGVWHVWRFEAVDAAPAVFDPFNTKAVNRHVNQWLFNCQERMGQAYSSTVLWCQLQGAGRAEFLWPADLPEAFLKRNAMGLRRYLPALAGVEIGGAAATARVRTQVAQAVQALWRERFGATVTELIYAAGLEAAVRIDQIPVDPVEAGLYFHRPVLPVARDAAQRNANALAAGGARTMERRFVMGTLSLADVSSTPAAVLLPFPWKHEADRLLADGATRLLLDAGEGGLPSDDAAFRQLRDGCVYAHRCQMLLQQGEAVADVLVWAATPVPALAQYSCDYANAAMLAGAAFGNGRVRFDSGRMYRVLAVTDEVLADPVAERMVRKMEEHGLKIWRAAQAKAPVNIVPDFEWKSEVEGMALRFLHRRVGSHEVYFVVNDSAEMGTVTCTFRDTGKGAPARWNSATGEIDDIELPQQGEVGGRVTVPLFMAPHDACFVVFER